LKPDITSDDRKYAPCHQIGGRRKTHKLFGDDLPAILEELNARLAA